MSSHSTDPRTDHRHDPTPKHWMRKAFTRQEDYAASFRHKHWAHVSDGDAVAEKLWRQYDVLVDVYKFYLDAAWKAAAWYYATTGAVLAYYYSAYDGQGEGDALLPLLLVFVAIMSGGFAYLAWRGARNLSLIPALLEHIAVNLRIPGRPHVEFAVIFLLMNGIMFALVGLGSLVLSAGTYISYL